MFSILQRFKSLKVKSEWQTQGLAGPTGSMRQFLERKEGKKERKKDGKKIPPVGFIQFMASNIDFIVRQSHRFTA